ncbi:hypothetical protein [Nonomuraea sp. JJY05]|uniref:hypothetical protein n=1 Tax=Nonomuraea sp. JJY05 TaxID=3350255 RepID=UPI00373F1610
MDADTWAAIAAIAAIAADVVAVVALYFAVTSARAAKESAKQAKAVARVEEERRAEERERWHEELKPPYPGKIETEVHGASLYGYLPALPRDYLIRVGLCDERRSGSTFRFQPQVRVTADLRHRFPIDAWPSKVPSRFVAAVKFWCPDLDDDDTGPLSWTCPCGRSGLSSSYVLDADDQLSGNGHWEWWAVPIELPSNEKAPAD